MGFLDFSTSVGAVSHGGPVTPATPATPDVDAARDYFGTPPGFTAPPAQSTPSERPGDQRVIRRILVFLALGMAGVLLIFAGLVWDAVVHARDPAGAHDEGSVFDLGNPAHQVLLLGGALAVAGLTAATARALSLSPGARLSSPRTSVALVLATVVAAAGTGGAVRWATTAKPPLATGPLAPSLGPERHGIGIVNSHASGECRPTKAQKAAAAKLVNDTEVATAKYRNFSAAVADNFVGPANPAVTEHYANIANTQDGRVLDPNRPESLMYTPTSKGMVLAGVMYMMNLPGEFGPEPGGCLTRWHIHANVCFSSATFQPATELTEEGASCPPGEFRYIPPPVLHVWLVDVPGGRFATEVDPKYLAQKLGP